jgi:hypothetical protein
MVKIIGRQRRATSAKGALLHLAGERHRRKEAVHRCAGGWYQENATTEHGVNWNEACINHGRDRGRGPSVTTGLLS